MRITQTKFERRYMSDFGLSTRQKTHSKVKGWKRFVLVAQPWINTNLSLDQMT
jgi:hypothetical protein